MYIVAVIADAILCCVRHAFVSDRGNDMLSIAIVIRLLLLIFLFICIGQVNICLAAVATTNGVAHHVSPTRCMFTRAVRCVLFIGGTTTTAADVAVTGALADITKRVEHARLLVPLTNRVT